MPFHRNPLISSFHLPRRRILHLSDVTCQLPHSLSAGRPISRRNPGSTKLPSYVHPAEPEAWFMNDSKRSGRLRRHRNPHRVVSSSPSTGEDRGEGANWFAPSSLPSPARGEGTHVPCPRCVETQSIPRTTSQNILPQISNSTSPPAKLGVYLRLITVPVSRCFASNFPIW